MSEHDRMMTSFSAYIKGTCDLMCPEKERILREREGLLHPLEIAAVEHSENAVLSRRKRASGCYRSDIAKAVKCYSRSAAGQKVPSPEDLRPAPVLHKTVNYLIHNVACEGIESSHWAERYTFVADRLRAVRQDMVIQGLPPEDCIQILEPMVKFHIFAAYWLCESPIDVFDPTINKTFLLECIMRLLVMYDCNIERNVSREPAGDRVQVQDFNEECCKEEFCKNEQHLMEALYLIIKLGDSHALHRSLLQGSDCASKCHACIQKKVMQISVAWRCGNYLSVCRALKFLPPLVSMAAILHLPVIRRHALMVMSLAYNSKVFLVPATYLQQILAWSSSSDVVNECSHYGIQCHTSNGDTSVNFLKGTFNVDAKVYTLSRLPWLNSNITTDNLRSMLSTQT